mgnify:CR=1 FL=1
MSGLNPKKMQGMMKQMGISQEEIDASKVTIEKSSGDKIIIENPSVQKISMQGQESFQVSGEITEESLEESEEMYTEEDVKTVMDKTGVDEETAKNKLEELEGDLADAIMQLSE